MINDHYNSYLKIRWLAKTIVLLQDLNGEAENQISSADIQQFFIVKKFLVTSSQTGKFYYYCVTKQATNI